MPFVILCDFVSLSPLHTRYPACSCHIDNNKRYGPQAAPPPAHRRTSSISNQLEGLHPGPEISGLIRPVGTPNHVDADVFPPLRAHAPDPSIFLPYVPEDIAFEEEYEEYLSGLGWTDSDPNQPPAPAGTSAWDRLPELAAEITDGISDSESIVSIGELGDEARMEAPDRDIPDENLNNWEVSTCVLRTSSFTC